MPGVSNTGRPVWKHDSRDDRLFFLGADNYWYFGSNWGPKVGIDVHSDQGGFIASAKKIEEGIFPTSYQYPLNGTWIKDSSIIVEGKAVFKTH